MPASPDLTALIERARRVLAEAAELLAALEVVAAKERKGARPGDPGLRIESDLRCPPGLVMVRDERGNLHEAGAFDAAGRLSLSDAISKARLECLAEVEPGQYGYRLTVEVPKGSGPGRG